MKSPGQVAYETFKDHVYGGASTPFDDLDSVSREGWEKAARTVRAMDDPPPTTGGGVGN